MVDAGALEGPTCRICFEGTEAGPLVQPCGCSGTQAHAHESCLLRWRRLQSYQGKLAAATRCEICGQKYSSSLQPPQRPFSQLLVEYARVFAETCGRLALCAAVSPQALCSPITLVLVGSPCLCFGLCRGILVSFVSFPVVVLILYINGLKLSVFGSPDNFYVGFSSFGAPVDGLEKGILLVSIAAGGLFERTVLYVLEHSDAGSLAVILNKPRQGKGKLVMNNLSIRDGGPLRPGNLCIHNIDGTPGAERLLAGHSIFLSHDLNGSLEALRESSSTERALVYFTGYASWGGHQLEGEVRRGAWGWIKAQHVRPDDVLQLDQEALEGMWECKISSPQLQVFEG